ncbi:CLUMA_CG005671, isoform B [Clunio marinus]|uniref:CLUMA_CG005671, isoform B n=1 Tax=Clunio marinus TaxID=568069 RepID=A0A1J1HXL0_9DIPT|nr:CLUMA_CG005671, isoform B [Clunio marinus]
MEATENKDKEALKRNYGKIILTLENAILSSEKLEASTVSQQDGLSKDIELDLRILGCELIQTAGILLKLPQVAMASGQVLFQRFFYSKSFVRHDMEAIAMGCICLASKIEEAPRRLRDVLNVFNHIKQIRAQKPITPMILDQNYVNLKNQVIKAERRVLKELGFCVHVKHPHKLIMVYLKYLNFDEDKNREMLQLAWNYMNDSFRTDVFVRYQPETIACACISLSARKLNINLTTSPSWFVIFKVQECDLIDACYRIMELYHRGKPDTEKLEAAVDELKKQYQDQRKKEHRNNSSPAVTIVDKTNGSSHNMWGGFIQRQVPSINSSNADEKTESKQKLEGKSVSSTNINNNHNERHSSKGRSRSQSRTRNSRSRSRSSDRHAKKKDRTKKRSHSRSPESDYEKKSRKRDKKYSKKSPKRDYREKSRERYSNGSRRRDYANDRDKERYSDKEYYSGYNYEKDKYSSSNHSSRNGNRHHHKSRR